MKGKSIHSYFRFNILIMMLSTIVIIFLFQILISDYSENVKKESANHLYEINYQFKLYFEESINNIWVTLETAVNTIESNENLTMDRIISTQKENCRLRNISNMYFYNEDGYCIDLYGKIKSGEETSKYLYELKSKSYFLEIQNSSIIYTLPIETNIDFNGSKLVAVSILKDLTHFMDQLKFSSFHNKAYFYLTRYDGQLICQLNSDNTPITYNVYNLFYGNIKCLNEEDKSLSDSKDDDLIDIYLHQGIYKNEYVVITPIVDKDYRYSLFYVVPEKKVNEVMNDFLIYILLLSFLFIIIFVLVLLIGVKGINRARILEFSSELAIREHLLDLLVNNTKYAFELLKLNIKDPIYVSKNVEKLIGDKYLVLHKIHGKYMLTGNNETGKIVSTIINENIECWDGSTEFVSQYIPCEINKQHLYLILKIYPVLQKKKSYIVIIYDATKERENEQVMKKTLLMADKANLAKTRFLANMSHDIRTPMNAIINMTRFALNRNISKDKLNEYLQTILDSSQHLLSLINDILDMSKIESGELSININPFNINNCLKDVCEMIKPLCENKNQTLKIDFSELTSSTIKGDRLKLSQILINLLNNAVKFTPENGLIEFKVYNIKLINDCDYETIRFIIKDNGIGISEEDILTIFNPFSRVNDNQVQIIEGTGLGLSICKNYVIAMGGIINCVSKLNYGSEFTVEINFGKVTKQIMATEEKSIAIDDYRFDGKWALLCEDNKVNQIIASELLKMIGFKVDIVENGEQAVNTFISSKDKYDIIYMDIQMPVMDGYQATNEIRKSEHPRANTIPIVAMTANVFSNDVEQAMFFGMNAHIGKPIDIKELKKITKKLLD